MNVCSSWNWASYLSRVCLLTRVHEPRLTVCLILTVAGCGHTKTVTTSSQTLDRREIASDARSRGQPAESSVISDMGTARVNSVFPSDAWKAVDLVIADIETGCINSTYTIVRAYCVATWGWPRPDKSFLLTGEKEIVDTELGEWTFGQGGRGLLGLPKGLEAPCFGCIEWRYRDATGTRLLAEDGISIDTLILTEHSSYDAQLIPVDVGAVASTSGVALGDSRERVEKLLGTPSQVSEFGRYDILWYLGRPEHHAVLSPPDFPSRPYDEGVAAAYALEQNKVVELWIHAWTTEALGG